MGAGRPIRAGIPPRTAFQIRTSTETASSVLTSVPATASERTTRPRVLSQRLEVSQPHSRKRMRADRFGNVIFEIGIPTVEETVALDLALIVERLAGQGPHLEAATTQALNVYLPSSAVTPPDPALRAAAAKLACSGEKGADLASAVGRWGYRGMSYGFDRTGVHATAGQALAAGTASARTTRT